MSVHAIGLDEFGAPEVLHEVELPSSEPGPGQVRIAVAAAAVNPTDLTVRSGGRAGQYENQPKPHVPGMDLAGTIDAIGEDADGRLQVGDPVIALVLPFAAARGAYTTSIVVDQRSVVRAPADASMPQAATLLLNAVTASLALDALRLASGSAVAMTGAPGAVGTYAAAIAHHRGLTVVTDSRPGGEDAMREAGADIVLPRGEHFVAELHRHFPDGVVGLVDGAALNENALAAITTNGVLASLKGWTGPTVRGIRLEAISSFGAVTDTARLEQVRDLAEAGVLQLRVAALLPAQDAAEAHRRVAAGGLDGRIVLDLTTLR